MDFSTLASSFRTTYHSWQRWHDVKLCCNLYQAKMEGAHPSRAKLHTMKVPNWQHSTDSRSRCNATVKEKHTPI